MKYVWMALLLAFGAWVVFLGVVVGYGVTRQLIQEIIDNRKKGLPWWS